MVFLMLTLIKIIMKIRILFLITFLSLFAFNSFSQSVVSIRISTDIFYGDDDEFIELRIVDTMSNQVVYDTSATVLALSGFQDTIMLTYGAYKCEVINIGANVSMPTIVSENGDTAVYIGYPNTEQYYLLIVKDPTVALNDMSSFVSVQVYPNPCRDFLKVDLGSSASNAKVELINQIGWVIKEVTFNDVSEVHLNTSDYPNGIYYLRLKLDTEVRTIKIVKN
jgi:hypothetical protein